MKILQASEQYFIATGLLIPDSRWSTLIKAYLTNFVCLFLMGPFLCGASGAYVYYNIHNIGECANAIMIVIGSFMCFNKYLCLRLYTETTKKLMKSFQKFVDQVPASKRHFYEEAETKGTFLTHLLVKVMLVCAFFVFGLLPLFNAVCKILFGNMDADKFIQVFQLKIPYYHHTVPEYFVRLTAIILITIVYQLVIVVPVTFFMNCCLIIEAGYQHFISLFNENDELKPKSKAIKIRLINAILLHKELISLTEGLQSAMSGPLFFQLSCYAIHTAACLNMVENELDYIGIAAIEAIFCMFASAFWVFIYCLYATRMTTILSMFGTVAFESKWYNYPIELRSYLILMIRRSQKSFYFNGFKIIRCDLETFARILRMVCSYYVALRKVRT